jgi:G protein-coupled receptor 112/deleted-in-malignant-brain-tumors protein 1/hemicentin
MSCGVSHLLSFSKVSLAYLTAIGPIRNIYTVFIYLHACIHNRKLRTSIHGQILINLSLALIGVYLFFLIGGLVTSVPTLCGISSALLHYFLLVYFGWTAVEAVWLYLKLVKVFGIQSLTSKFTIKAGIPTWGEL